MKNLRYIAFDTETGGLEPKLNPILTAYFAIIGDDFSKIDELDIKIRVSAPYDKVEEDALRVNGIDIAAHNADPNTLDRPEAIKRITEFLAKHKGKGKYDKPHPLGHNLDFDLRMIFEQIMPMTDWEKYVSYAARDTKKASDFLKDFGILPPEIGNLGSLVKHFGIPQLSAHTAKDDVLMTVEVFRKLGELVKKGKGGGGLSLDVLDILEK